MSGERWKKGVGRVLEGRQGRRGEENVEMEI